VISLTLHGKPVETAEAHNGEAAMWKAVKLLIAAATGWAQD
jgi:hypothetical protein